MRETFEIINFSQTSLRRLEQITAILEEYQTAGYDSSLLPVCTELDSGE